VIGTPVNFGGMTGRALAVILKLNFSFFYYRKWSDFDGTHYTYLLMSSSSDSSESSFKDEISSSQIVVSG
jgi:hypothetical protein